MEDRSVSESKPAGIRGLRASPYIHVGPDRLHNPLTDETLLSGSADYALVRALLESPLEPRVIDDASRERLALDGWIVAEGDDQSARHRLKIVSLETNSVCNQACYFCPVSVDPREDSVMPDELFTSIVDQLRAYRETLDAIFLQSYNEPTVDRRFVRHVREIMTAGLPVAVLTNGTGLTPSRVGEILEAGPLRFLSVNFSTMNPERYARDRGKDQTALVLRNLDAMKNLRVAREMKILVLGQGDDDHRRDFEEIRARFDASNFVVESHLVMDRAGYFEFGLRPTEPIRKLRGCDNVGSRPIQHLHVTPKGLCVLCCEDYDENYVVGNLNMQRVAEVLSGPEMSRMRRWAYGVEEAPVDFICRRCVFALGGE